MRIIQVGSSEYLTVTVTANVTLSAQAVAISFDRHVWISATWLGSPGTTRDAQALLTVDNVPSPGTWPIYVKVTDSPEIPVVQAGSVLVQ